MDDQLKTLTAPSRTALQKQQSFNKIQMQIQKSPKKFNWQYYATLVTAAILVMVLIASFKDVSAQPITTQGAALNEIEKVFIFSSDEYREEPIRNMSKWYYLGKGTLKESEIEQLKPLFEKLENTIPTKLDELDSSSINLIIQYSDGTEHYVQLMKGFYTIINKDTNEASTLDIGNGMPRLVNIDTKQEIELTYDESYIIEHILDDHEKSLFHLLRLLIIVGISVLYMNILQKVSPKRLPKDEEMDKKYRNKLILSVIGTWVLVWVLLGISLFLFSAYNLLFIICTLSILFTSKLLFEYLNGNFKRSYWEVPISVVFYLCFILVYIQ